MRISTKLLSAIGAVVIAASVAVGWFVFRNGEEALRAQVTAQLSAERDSRARLVSNYFHQFHEQVRVASKLFVTQIALGDRRRAREVFDPIARGLIEGFDYPDILLVGVDGVVLYSSEHDPALGSSLRGGKNALAQAFTRAVSAPADAVAFVDYQRYPDQSGVPAGFAASPVFDFASKRLLGVIVFRVAIDNVNAIMTDAAGVGRSGETYLVGPDFSLRSSSRYDTVSSILVRKSESAAARRSLAGETGTTEQDDYRGVRTLAAFAPIEIEGLRWGIVAKVDRDEAFAPVGLFRNQLLLVLLIVGLSAGVVLWEALRRIVLRPVEELAAGAQRVASRDYTHPVGLSGGDELGQLGRSFDGMMSSVLDDINDRLAAERRIKESEERLAAAARGGNLGLWDVDASTRTVLVNPIFESQLGYAPGELRDGTGKWAGLRDGLARWVEMIHPEERERVQAAIARYFAGEAEIYHEEHRVRRGDGTYAWILSIGNSIDRDAQGKPLRVNGVHIDISEMKGLQELRDGLVHMIVHDLRSPLTGVMGYIELLRSPGAASIDDRARFVEEAYGGASEMAEMISSLLDINRLEANEMPVDRQRVDLRDVAAEAMRSLGGLMVNRRVTMAPGDAVMSNCDRALIRRVIGNLLGNALKFTPESGTITITVSNGGGRPNVEVADTGPGIPADFIPRVFDKFSQAGEGRKRKKYSSGLGLAFCKLAVEAHGGTIGVTSEVGVGSRFWFQLP